MQNNLLYLIKILHLILLLSLSLDVYIIGNCDSNNLSYSTHFQVMNRIIIVLEVNTALVFATSTS